MPFDDKGPPYHSPYERRKAIADTIMAAVAVVTFVAIVTIQVLRAYGVMDTP